MTAQAQGSAVQTVPKTMRAAAIDRSGGSEMLSLRSLPVPEFDAGDVLIAVDTAGVGDWDADMREGWSPRGRARFPLVLGSDGAGTVAAVGSRVRRFSQQGLCLDAGHSQPRAGRGLAARHRGEPADYARWLGEEEASADELRALLRPYPHEPMRVYPIGLGIGNVRNEGPELIDAVGPDVTIGSLRTGHL